MWSHRHREVARLREQLESYGAIPVGVGRQLDCWNLKEARRLLGEEASRFGPYQVVRALQWERVNEALQERGMRNEGI